MTPAEKLASRRPARKRGQRARPRNRTWPGCRLRELRESLGLSYREVSGAVGLSIAGLYEVEMGADTLLSTARRLAAFYGESVEELWGEAKEGR